MEKRCVITISNVPVEAEADVEIEVDDLLESLDSDAAKLLFESLCVRMSDETNGQFDVDRCCELFDGFSDYDRRRVLCRCFNAVNYDDSRSVLDGVSRLF